MDAGYCGHIIVNENVVPQISTESESLALTEEADRTMSLAKLIMERRFKLNIEIVAMQDNLHFELQLRDGPRNVSVQGGSCRHRIQE